MLIDKKINSPDSVNLSFNGLGLKPRLTGFIFTTMETKMLEIWRNIPHPDYENDYQVSTFGRVKSLKNGRGKILKPYLGKRGYLHVNLSQKKKGVRTFYIHILVAMAFLNHKPNGFKKVVDHKDFNKLNNFVTNLRLVTNRENSSHRKKPHTSKYTGVSWAKKNKKWQAAIQINRENIYLGLYDDEYQAHLAYQNALNNLKAKA